MTRRSIEPDRQARIAAICDGARVREALGQAATHRRLPDGRHEVSLYDRAAGRLCTWTGRTLTAAIRRAKGHRQ